MLKVYTDIYRKQHNNQNDTRFKLSRDVLIEAVYPKNAIPTGRGY